MSLCGAVRREQKIISFVLHSIAPLCRCSFVSAVGPQLIYGAHLTHVPTAAENLARPLAGDIACVQSTRAHSYIRTHTYEHMHTRDSAWQRDGPLLGCVVIVSSAVIVPYVFKLCSVSRMFCVGREHGLKGSVIDPNPKPFLAWIHCGFFFFFVFGVSAMHIRVNTHNVLELDAINM